METMLDEYINAIAMAGSYMQHKTACTGTHLQTAGKSPIRSYETECGLRYGLRRAGALAAQK